MKRIAAVIPGNDCFYGACRSRGCPGRRGSSGDGHGICGEQWTYAVLASDGLTALRLTVFTDIYPPTVPVDHSSRCGNRCTRCGHGAHDSGRCGNVNSGNDWGRCRCDCPATPLGERRTGADLTFHVGFPTSKEGLRTGATGLRGCDLLPGGWCDSDDTTALGARTFFARHGDPAQCEQSASFWEALERLAEEKETHARAERVDDKYERCDHCDGTGVVAKEPRT